ncbi:hypothetical protein BUE80_DR009322 [Diplocarpon rosae]|nr:hypothetical protein BUE80_DR009322 [Diplocarpon rosae]
MPADTASSGEQGSRIDEGETFRCQEQAQDLEAQIKALKELILEGFGDILNSPNQASRPLSTTCLSKQVFDPSDLTELATERDAYLTRIRRLEERLRELLSLEQSGSDLNNQILLARINVLTVERDRLHDEIHGGDGYLSQIQSLRMIVESEAVEPEVIVRLNTALAETQAAIADRDSSLYDVDELNELVDAMAVRLQQVVDHRNILQTQRNRLQAQIDVLVDRNFEIGETEGSGDAAERGEKRTIRELEHPGGGQLNQSQSRSKSPMTDMCEDQLFRVRSERDSAIRQNEEARRNIATRTAERNGAHQRIKFLEEQAIENCERELSLQEELRKEKKKQDETRPGLPSPRSTDCDAERKEFVLLKKELISIAIEAASLQYDRDAARAEVRSLTDENAAVRIGVQAANKIVMELQCSLAAANNATLAERDRAQEARTTGNRLRVGREIVRLEANKLRAELAAAQEVSLGLLRKGDISRGDLVHMREEKDAAVNNVAKLRDTLTKANQNVEALQKRLDDCLGKHAGEPTASASFEEVNSIAAERDAAFARGRELEHVLEDLEEDYRKNLDQWEQQTKRDEREISTSQDRLNDCLAQVNNLSAELVNAHKRLEDAESHARGADARARAAHQRADSAESRFAVLEIQLLRARSDLDAVKNLASEPIQQDGTVLSDPRVSLAEGEDPRADTNPIPFPPSSRTSSASAKKDPQLSSVTTNPQARSTSPTAPPPISTARSQVRDASLFSVPRRGNPDSPSPSPMPRPRSQGFPPLLYTSPAISTITSPRATRNKDPDYGGKRKLESGFDNGKARKRKRR